MYIMDSQIHVFLHQQQINQVGNQLVQVHHSQGLQEETHHRQ